jgi:hypothetical protein
LIRSRDGPKECLKEVARTCWAAGFERDDFDVDGFIAASGQDINASFAVSPRSSE